VHVGVVTTSYPRFAGDPAGGFVHGLNRDLLRRGHRVTVVSAGDLVAPTEAQLDGVTVHRLPSSLFFQGGAPDALASGLAVAPLSTMWLAGRFTAALLGAVAHRLSRCDVLLSHWLVPSGLVAQLLPGKRPQLAVAHSSDIHLLRRLRLAGLGRWVAERARLVYSAEHLRLDGAPGVVVPMGIAVSEFTATDHDRAAARQALGLGRPMVLFLGRLVPVKGLDVLLTALERLSPQQSVELVVAGDGPLRSWLTREAARRGLTLRCLGEVHGRRKQQLLWAADVLVLPSLKLTDGRTEGAPVVVWEALAAGCPVVASEVGGIAGQLDGAGLLVPAGAADELAVAIRQILTDRDLASSLCRHGMLRAQAADWSCVTPQLLGPDLAKLLLAGR
jgi:glycosyltransferase involved in cell wall biosynthesis